MSNDGCTNPNGHFYHNDEEMEDKGNRVEFFPIKWCIRCGDKQYGSSYTKMKDENGHV